jgi:hypothetical protein
LNDNSLNRKVNCNNPFLRFPKYSSKLEPSNLYIDTGIRNFIHEFIYFVNEIVDAGGL